MAKRLAPGPRGHFLFGNIREHMAEGPAFTRRVARLYGDVATIRLSWRRAYFVTSPEAVRQVLIKDAEGYRKAPFYRVLLRRFLGDGLLTTDGAFWRRQRDLSQPAFHHARIAAYAGVMVAHAERTLRGWQPGQVVNINADMKWLTLGIIARTLFDYDLAGEADPFGQALTTLIRMNSEVVASPFLSLPLWIPTSRNRRQKRAIQELDRLVFRIIHERRKTNEDRGDLLSMLMLARNESGTGMTDRQLRDEAMTLASAGHETLATALVWTWTLLAQNPDVEARLHQELDRVLGGRAPTFDDLRRLEYTEMVVKESMRLYPPIPVFARQAQAKTTVMDYDVPRNTIIFIGVDAMQHDPRWFDEPDEFRPERFSKENEKLIPKYAYMPFGGGAHVCIGSSFAMMEAVLLLATLARKYRLRLMPDQRIELEALLTLHSKQPILMRLEAREPAPDGAAAATPSMADLET